MNETQKLIKQIEAEDSRIIELTCGGYNTYTGDSMDNIFECGGELKPTGDFAAMVEFFSFSLVDRSEDQYQGAYGPNTQYIKDSMKLIQEIEREQIRLQNKYEEKGVKITISDYNTGCEGGLALYVWIPYQGKDYKAEIPVHGSLFVNHAKYEYVDKIIVGYEEVDIYNKGVVIGSILRENIKTLVEYNYKNSCTFDFVEEMLFDIRKVGDF